MRKIEDVILKNGKNLKEVLELHYKWVKDSENGRRADLSNEDLSYVDFSNSDLSNADFTNADFTGSNMEDANLKYSNLRIACFKGVNMKGINLSYTDLRGSNLIEADLSEGYLRGANLNSADLFQACLECAILRNANLINTDFRKTNLRKADLSYTNLYNANFSYADLSYANFEKAELVDTILTNIKYNSLTTFLTLQCPEEGSFIGYKKAGNKIVKLLITKDAKRSSATTRKCRCSKAKVLSITSLDGKEEYTKVASDRNKYFIYEIGKIVQVKDFDENRWNECTEGIHFFITRDEAVMS